MDANNITARKILGAVKDPNINNQLSDLHESFDGLFARSAILMLDMLRPEQRIPVPVLGPRGCREVG